MPTTPDDRPRVRERVAVFFAAAALLSQWAILVALGSSRVGPGAASLDLLFVMLGVTMWSGMLIGLLLSSLSALAYGPSRATVIAFGLIVAWWSTFLGVFLFSVAQREGVV